MTAAYDLIIRGATIVNHDGRHRADVGVRDGKTAAIGDLGRADAAEVVEAPGLHLLPGVIDTQVHFREPGLEHKEDLASGSLAAVKGGVTAVFEMPNTKPTTSAPADLLDKLNRAKGRMWCDHAFFAGATGSNAEILPEMERIPGCSGVKVFMGASTGDLLVAEDELLARVLANAKRRVTVHCEDEFRMRERRHLADTGDVRQHCHWRDAESALRATRRLIKLARAARRPVHVLHVTTADEITFLAANKDIATMEITPQHLTLAAPECYETLGTYAQMNPPIREAHHREGLWRGIVDGIADVVGSDHAPHTKEEKAKPYPNSPSGMPGVQTLLPLLLDHCAAGRLTLERVVDLTSAGAQRVFGLAGKGRLAVGYDADYTLVDLAARRTITGEWLASRCGWSPFEGREVNGWPIATIIRGNVVMRDDQVLGTPLGAPVKFVEALPPAA